MFSPLLQSIIEREGFDVIDASGLDGFTAAHDYVALFFSGDADRLMESNDVAVVLPELHKAFDRVFTPAIVNRESERELQRKYRFNAYPAIVFLKDGEYQGVLQNVLDWDDYLREVSAILVSPTSAPPAYELPEGCAVSAVKH
ncbi:MAG: hypothetical protein MRY74_07625 [Neomegalonema sp.]|nr:hypothetical protein [Neomegalonema sp.]